MLVIFNYNAVRLNKHPWSYDSFALRSAAIIPLNSLRRKSFLPTCYQQFPHSCWCAIFSKQSIYAALTANSAALPLHAANSDFMQREVRCQGIFSLLKCCQHVTELVNLLYLENKEMILNGYLLVHLSKAFMCCMFVEVMFLRSKVMIGQCKHLALSSFTLWGKMCLHD